MKKYMRCVSWLSAVLLIFTLCSCSTSRVMGSEYNSKLPLTSFQYDKVTAVETGAPVNNSEKLADFKFKTETDLLTLYVNETTSCVAVEDKRSGKLWTTIPLDLDTDTLATADMQDIMRSVLKIEYYDNNVLKTVYS